MYDLIVLEFELMKLRIQQLQIDVRLRRLENDVHEVRESMRGNSNSKKPLPQALL